MYRLVNRVRRYATPAYEASAITTQQYIDAAIKGHIEGIKVSYLSIQQAVALIGTIVILDGMYVGYRVGYHTDHLSGELQQVEAKMEANMQKTEANMQKMEANMQANMQKMEANMQRLESQVSKLNESVKLLLNNQNRS